MHRTTYCILSKVAATAAMHEAMQSVMSRGLWDLMRGHDESDIRLSSSHAFRATALRSTYLKASQGS